MRLIRSRHDEKTSARNSDAFTIDTRYVCRKLRFTGLGVLSSIGGALGLYLGFSLLDGHRVVSLLLAQAAEAARGARMCFK